MKIIATRALTQSYTEYSQNHTENIFKQKSIRSNPEGVKVL